MAGSLESTGKDVEKGGGTFWIYTVFFTDIFCNCTVDQDCNSVIGCCNVSSEKS